MEFCIQITNNQTVLETTGVTVDDSRSTTRLYTLSSAKSSHAGLYSCAVEGAGVGTKALRVQCKQTIWW